MGRDVNKFTLEIEKGVTKCNECMFHQGLCRFPDELHSINCYEFNLATVKIKKYEEDRVQSDNNNT